MRCRPSPSSWKNGSRYAADTSAAGKSAGDMGGPSCAERSGRSRHRNPSDHRRTGTASRRSRRTACRSRELRANRAANLSRDRSHARRPQASRSPPVRRPRSGLSGDPNHAVAVATGSCLPLPNFDAAPDAVTSGHGLATRPSCYRCRAPNATAIYLDILPSSYRAVTLIHNPATGRIGCPHRPTRRI